MEMGERPSFIDNTIMLRWLKYIGSLLVGLIIGGGIGLLLGWLVWPTEYTEATPLILEDEYRQDYLLMAAAAYAVDGDLVVATERIDSLGVNGRNHLFDITIDTILTGGNEQHIHQLVQLAADLGLSSPAMTPFLTEPTP